MQCRFKHLKTSSLYYFWKEWTTDVFCLCIECFSSSPQCPSPSVFLLFIDLTMYCKTYFHCHNKRASNSKKVLLWLLHVPYTLKGLIHSGSKCLPRVACLWSKMPMFQRVGMREGGEPLPLAFQHLILMIWRPCDSNLVMISSLASK